MPEILMEPVTGPTAWTGADLENDSSWDRPISAAARAELEAALAAVKARGLTVHTLHREDFPAGPAIRALAQEIIAETRDGRGFVVLRGFPIEGHSDDDIRLMYWGLGSHMGTGLSQDAEAALVANVRERHVQMPKGTRAYGSKRDTPLHIDLTDVVGLLGVRQALGAPKSTLCSSVTVYNRVLAEHPEWLPRLYEGFHWDRRNEQAEWDDPVTPWKVPLFSHANGQVSVRYNRPWITAAWGRRGEEVPADVAEMFDFIDKAANESMIKFPMKAGDVYFASNHTVFHGREPYEEEPDWDVQSQRLFLRLWLNIPGFRAYADERVIRDGLIDHGNLGWTNDELVAGHHLKPGFKRTFIEARELSQA